MNRSSQQKSFRDNPCVRPGQTPARGACGKQGGRVWITLPAGLNSGLRNSRVIRADSHDRVAEQHFAFSFNGFLKSATGCMLRKTGTLAIDLNVNLTLNVIKQHFTASKKDIQAR